MVGLTIAAALLLTAAADQTPKADGPSSLVSIERIREQVQRPQVLQLPPLPPLPGNAPVFRLTIEERPFPVESALDLMWRGIAESPRMTDAPVPGRPTSPVPLVGVDLIRLAMQIANSIGEARRARAVAAAREEVQAALAEFCASHDCSVTEPGLPSHGEGILIPGKR